MQTEDQGCSPRKFYFLLHSKDWKIQIFKSMEKPYTSSTNIKEWT